MWIVKPHFHPLSSFIYPFYLRVLASPLYLLDWLSMREPILANHSFTSWTQWLACWSSKVPQAFNEKANSTHYIVINLILTNIFMRSWPFRLHSDLIKDQLLLKMSSKINTHQNSHSPSIKMFKLQIFLMPESRVYLLLCKFFYCL